MKMKKLFSVLAAIAVILTVSGCKEGATTPESGSTGSGAVGAVVSGTGGVEDYHGTDIGAAKPSASNGIVGGIADAVSGIFGGSSKDSLAADFAVGGGSAGGGIAYDAAMTEGVAAPPAAGGMGGMVGSAGAADDVVTGGGLKGETDDFDPGFIIDPILPLDPELPEKPQPTPQSGLLTGGEWNDNAHWSEWLALYGKRDDWNGYKKEWHISFDHRAAVKVTDGSGAPIDGAKVSCANGISSAVTDNKGMAYLFFKGDSSGAITVDTGSDTKTLDSVSGDGNAECSFNIAPDKAAPSLDLMLMVDTTGSMSDELEYLKVELESIVRKIQSDNSNINVRTSVNFYRDEGDDYVVRQFPFTGDIEQSAGAIKEQRAEGGGDFPEAVHEALDSAVNNHDWNSSVRIMFLVLDAPPHSENAQIVDAVNKHVKEAAEAGIRIIPIASSGIDKTTEYLLRTMAFTTGGTYTFLTNDSGIGGEHIEPTVGAYNVEKLSEMMVRIVNGYIG